MRKGITIARYVEIRTDKELIDEFTQLEDLIFNFECFGTKDMVLYTYITKELEKRGYTAYEKRLETTWQRC